MTTAYLLVSGACCVGVAALVWLLPRLLWDVLYLPAAELDGCPCGPGAHHPSCALRTGAVR